MTAPTANATKPVQSAGAELHYDSDGQGTFVKITNVVEIGQIGNEGNFLDATAIDAEDPSSALDRSSPAELAHILNDVPGDTVQTAFLASAAAGEVDMKVIFKSGRVRTFTALYHKPYTESPAQGSLSRIGLAGRVQGGITDTDVEAV